MMRFGEKYLLIFLLLFAISFSFPVCAMIPAWNITNREYISDIAISADGSRLITGTMTGIATVYDHNGTIVWKTQVPGSLLVGCRENGSSFIIGSQENIYSNKGSLRSYASNGSSEWKVNTGCVVALGLSGKNNRTVVGNRKGDVIVLGGKGEEVVKFNDSPLTNVVSEISVSDKGKEFVYTLHEMYPRVRYVTIDTQKKYVWRPIFNASQTGYGGGEQITAIAISSDGKYVIASYGEGSHGTLILYTSGSKLWSKDIGEIRDIVILANGSAVFAGKVNGDVLGYSRSGNLSFNFSTPSSVTSLSLAVDKNIVAIGTDIGNLYLINDSGNILWASRIDEFPIAEISEIEISRNGESLAVLVNNKDIYYFVNKTKPVVYESPKNNSTPIHVKVMKSNLPNINRLPSLRFFLKKAY